MASHNGKMPTLPTLPSAQPQMPPPPPQSVDGYIPALDHYAAIDLTPNSVAYAEFMQQVDIAAQQAMAAGTIQLNLSASDVPHYLTPTMTQWYQRVAAVREPALAGVRAAFENGRLENGAQTRFAKGDRDRTEDEFIAKKIRAVQEHRNNRQFDYNKLQQLSEQESTARNAYKEMRAELDDREPTVLKTKVYFAALAGVAALEALINYESFAAVKWASPAIALGMTLLVAVALAFASHAHGTLLKQREYYVGAHRADISRGSAYQLFGLGTSAFTLALGAVYYARDLYLTDIALLRSSTGSMTDDNPLWIIGGSLIGNVIVYAVGVFIAYFMHDPNPEFPKKLLELQRLERQRKILLEKLEKERWRPLERVTAEYEEAIKGINSRENQQRRAPGSALNDALLAKLETQDRLVEAALGDFRSRFLSAISQPQTGGWHQPQQGVRLIKQTDLNENVTITAADYNSMPLKLKYGHL